MNYLAKKRTKANVYSEKKYQIANVYRIFFARFFDLLILAIPWVILNATWKSTPGDWLPIIVLVTSSFLATIVYFVIIPYWTKGNTLGKLLFQIRLKQKGKGKPDFLPLLFRESYFLLIPWFLAFLFQVITILIFQSTTKDKETADAIWMLVFLKNIGFLFYGLWLFFVGMSIKFQKNHQASVDLKYGVYVVYKEEFHGWSKPNKDKLITNQETHVSLKEQPGNFNEDQIEEIQNIDKEGEKNE
ncbi:RDD family protein [Williamsoniiplasma luminosum]|uniref:RDD domain-containing protein n=1 Tax=Williamsoniiplasma luminosum TaxID=214888 RepID=A0A2S0NKA2_9MOLU|nr:RDD family protein [Williamsoniiplasma luminosum]AVP49450.1 MAG: hypothetical protein C5T88_02630 [Williamsoniiplasma luminosum]